MQNQEKKYEKEKHIAFGFKYRDRLRNFLMVEENQKFMFSKENEADSWRDFNLFPTIKTDRDHLCLPNEPMLIDRNYEEVHTYCVCTVSENGKITNEYPVIPVDKIPYGVWRNGYFLLPKFKLE